MLYEFSKICKILNILIFSGPKGFGAYGPVQIPSSGQEMSKELESIFDVMQGSFSLYFYIKDL